MDSEVIYNPKKITHSLTYLVNNIGLRDASASKNHQNLITGTYHEKQPGVDDKQEGDW